MSSYNRVILLGNMTRDIEIRDAGASKVGNFGIAMNTRYSTKGGGVKEEVTFVDCEAWGRQAEAIQQYLGKGKPIHIEGRLKLDSWKTKEGDTRNKLKVVVESFCFVGAKSGSSAGDESSMPAGAASSRSGATVPDDEVPF